MKKTTVEDGDQSYFSCRKKPTGHDLKNRKMTFCSTADAKKIGRKDICVCTSPVKASLKHKILTRQKICRCREGFCRLWQLDSQSIPYLGYHVFVHVYCRLAGMWIDGISLCATSTASISSTTTITAITSSIMDTPIFQATTTTTTSVSIAICNDSDEWG
jgi:hypothetical protein